MDGVFEARPSRGKLIAMLAGALLFVAISLFIILNPDMIERRRWAIPAAYVGLPFFLLCAGLFGRMLFSGAVQVRVDANGIYWRRWQDMPIPFSEIERAWHYALMGQSTLCLALRQPDRYPSKSAVLRASAKANKRMGAGDVAISMNGLDRSFDELMDAVAYWGSRNGVPVARG